MSALEIRAGDRDAAFRAASVAHPAGSPFIPQMRADLLRFLDPARNPFATEGRGRFEVFTAHRDGRAVGRVVASVHDASNRRHGERQGRFGFLDLVDDPEVADGLLGHAEAWARERGMVEMAGNFSLTAMQQVGVVTSGHENPPYTDMTWTPPHVAAHLARRGYAAVFPMTTFEADLSAVDPDALVGPRGRELLADPDYAFVPVTRRGLQARLLEARRALNAGFDRNPMFVPPSEAEFAFQAGEMTWILDPRLSVLVRHRGEPVGTVICIPDLAPFMRATGGRLGPMAAWHFLRHRMTRTRAVVVFYSVAPAHQGRGLNGLMLSRVAAALKGAGYARLGITWISDLNRASLRQMERLGARPLHRLHLFRKDLPS